MTDQPSFINMQPGRLDQIIVPAGLKNKEIKTGISLGGYSLNLQARTPQKPRVDMIFFEGQKDTTSICVFFPISKLEVAKSGGKSSIDLTKVMPAEWSLSLVTERSDTDEEYQFNSPEKLVGLLNLNQIKPPGEKGGEVIIGPIHKLAEDPKLLSAVAQKDYVPVLLWNVFFAKAVAQFGLPADQQSADFIRQKVEERRKKVLDGFDVLNSAELLSLATSNY